MAATTAVAVGGLAALTAPPAQAAVNCQVTLTPNYWGGGFVVNLKVNNTGDAWSNWSLTFNWGGDQRITNGWSAKWSQSGSAVTVTNESWNGNVPSGGSIEIGGQGTWSSNQTNPSSYAVNGVTCGGQGGTTTTTTTRPTTTTTRATTTTTRATTTTTRGTTTTTRGTTTTTTRGTTTTTRPTTTTTTRGTTTTTTRATTTTTTGGGGGNKYEQEFLDLYDKIKAPGNGYFSPDGVPYHTIETLLVEAPDYGHETTSEAFSYYVWLEAEKARLSGDWTAFNNSWSILEKYMIPSRSTYKWGSYNPADPADYAPEADQPSKYPVSLDSSVPAGGDPLYTELSAQYGAGSMYQMHWLLDVDNIYGFGQCGDKTSKNAFINTYQRGSQESVWETLPQPSCDTFTSGRSNGGFLPLFIKESNPAKQWKFTSAPDADARAIQAAYWANVWATEQGKQSQISTTLANAAKMGDYLRYAMYDKYFKLPGCTSVSCAGGSTSNHNASNYLLNWYISWGSGMDATWAYIIGSSGDHQGYQNPLTAYALSTVSALTPKSPTAKADWATSVTRQIQFYTWLQSSEGAFAGGANNSWDGVYATPPSSLPKFYGLTYDYQPVWHDPPSNRWFGFQAWSVERLAEYYYVSKDAKAGAVLDKWVSWALAHTTVSGTDVQFPSDLSWSGQPGGSWTASTTSVNNAGLHVTVDNYTNDIGVAGAYARLLAYYGAASGNAEAKNASKALLDSILSHKDSKGISIPEVRKDYNRFVYNRQTNGEDGLFVPSTYTGTYPNGDPINSSSTFLSIRSWYKQDPDWPKVQAYLDGGEAPTFTYHRFWAQVDIATALADYARLFPNG
jgi:hypothetical protein